METKVIFKRGRFPYTGPHYINRTKMADDYPNAVKIIVFDFLSQLTECEHPEACFSEISFNEAKNLFGPSSTYPRAGTLYYRRCSAHYGHEYVKYYVRNARIYRNQKISEIINKTQQQMEKIRTT